MAIKGLSEIAWRSDSFDKLVLADDEKKLVRALVEHNDGSFSDLIEGKAAVASSCCMVRPARQDPDG